MACDQGDLRLLATTRGEPGDSAPTRRLQRYRHPLGNFGNVVSDQRTSSARALYEGLAIVRELGNQLGTANALYNLGRVVHFQGDLAARSLNEERLAIRRNWATGLGGLLLTVWEMASEQGESAARALFRESLDQRELGDRRGMVYSFGDWQQWLPHSVTSSARPESGAGRSDCGGDRLPMPPNERPLYDRRVAAARAALR